VYQLPERTVIEGQAKRLYQLLTARNRSRQAWREDTGRSGITESDAACRDAASKLGRVLLGPLAAKLGHKRLVIVSDGALRYVPFAALSAPSASGVSANNYVPLMVQHEIVELPSASVLTVLRGNRSDRRPIAKQVMVIADPVFAATDVRVRRTTGGEQLVSSNQADRDLAAIAEESLPESERQLTRSLAELDLSRDGKLGLPRLLFSRREAAAILAFTPKGQGTEALDFAANRRLAMSGNLTQYRIVHFATHALVDNDHPELSGLVLSLVDEHGNPQQGFLDLQDIYNLDLGADLVVLSACETALGKQIDGEGMMGLTRGFMYAGAPRVVGTLWQVQDFATAKFMTIFYEAMQRKQLSPAQALREAQLALWRDKQSSAPYYWAAFTLQGEWK